MPMLLLQPVTAIQVLDFQTATLGTARTLPSARLSTRFTTDCRPCRADAEFLADVQASQM
jgi:hypothetical protein